MTQFIIVVIFFVCFIVVFAFGYMVGLGSKCKDKDEEAKWWENQTHEALKEVNDWKRKYNDMQCKYNKERNKVYELEQNFEAYLTGRKIPGKTIADKNQQAIRELHEDGLSDKQIADLIGCGKSTIQRAIKKWGLR